MDQNRLRGSYNPQQYQNQAFNYEPVQNPIGTHGNAQDDKGMGYEVRNTDIQYPSNQNPSVGFFSSIRWWLPEIGSCILSLGCFAAIAAVARHYQGRGVESVGLAPGLTLNGLIALLSTLNRVFLMVPVASALSQEVWVWLSESRRSARNRQLRDLELSDAASRGAFGSFLFLFQFRRGWLAHCAALVTIVSLAFGTFTQQLLSFKSFAVNEIALQPGTLPRAETYQDYVGRPSEGSSPTLLLKAATYSGVLTSDVKPLQASCPTGNCTWPITPTLGVCGGCTKQTYTKQCGVQNVPGIEGVACQYSMPSGSIGNITDYAASGSEGVGFNVIQTQGYTYNQTLNGTLYLAVFDIVGAPANYNAYTWPEDQTVSSECALWMCVQALETQQTNGNQTQQVVETWSRVVNSKQIEVDENPFGNVTFEPLPSTMNPTSGHEYGVGELAINGFSSYFPTLFNGNTSLNQEDQISTSDVIQAIFNTTGDLDTWIQNVANSMTNVIRVGEPAQPQSLYMGTGYQFGYNIRWPWIILPGILVALSVFILFVIMVKTARSPVNPWKGSPLTLLFMDVDAAIRRSVPRQMDQYKGFEKTAGKSPVVVQPDAMGNWALKTA